MAAPLSGPFVASMDVFFDGMRALDPIREGV